MNDNTILRIKVPAHLYESVKEQLTLNEAKKQNYGAGYSVVKEKKMKTPKDGMQKVEEIDYVPGSNPDIDDKTASDALSGIKKETKDTEMEKKTRSLEELKAAKAKLDEKIKQMEGVNENVEENINEYYGVDPKLDLLTLALGVGLPVATAAAALVQQIGIKGALNLLKKSNAPKEKKAEVEKAIVAAEKGEEAPAVTELFGLGGSKFKDGDKVYIKVNGEFEKTPRKINLRSGKPFKQDGKTMYFLTQPEDERGQFWTSGGTSASEDNIQLAK